MRRLTTIAVLGAALALGACGGDDDDDGGGGGDQVSAEEYASAICSSTQDWVGSLQKRATDLGESLGTDVSPEQGKDALAGFLDDVIADTDDWIAGVTDAGVPDVSGGEQAAEDLRAAAEEAKGVLEDTRASVEDLPTDDEAEFAREADEVGNATEESLGKVGDAIAEPESDELRTALEETEECKQLAGA